ncbi:adenylyl-sulfate kinase [Ekhidna sp.]|uniref:adenylyl-sulfate kinase n=1 Tax=Ekhidna sp. TaxID=2608089 RepID=UPI003299FF22
MSFKEDIIPHSHSITRTDRNSKSNHASKVIWFTGLSGSGKSTLASALESFLHQKGFNTYILDGDNVRAGLNNDLDFSDKGRKENIRRIAEVSKLFVDAGVVAITAFISPFREEREKAKKIVGKEDYIEVHVDCPLEVCEERDVKGLYKKAREGKIKHFTGIDSPFEIPENADIVVNTANNSLANCLEDLIENIEQRLRL